MRVLVDSAAMDSRNLGVDDMYRFEGRDLWEREAAQLMAAITSSGGSIDIATARDALAKMAGYANSESIPQGSETPWCNRYQRAALAAYDFGNLSFLADVQSREEYAAHLANCGDSLLILILSELATDQDCDSLDVALRRIRAIGEQVADVAVAIEALDDCAHCLDLFDTVGRAGTAPNGRELDRTGARDV